jgi:hypothetical protein
MISCGPAREEALLAPRQRPLIYADGRVRSRVSVAGNPEHLLPYFRKGSLTLAGAAGLAAIGAWLSMTAGASGSAPLAARVLAVALLAGATSLLLHGLSHVIAGVREFRALRQSKRRRPTGAVATRSRPASHHR